VSAELLMHAITATARRPPLVPLGRTGLVATAVGLGLAGVGRPAYMTLGRDADLGADRSVAAMRRRCHALLDAAYDAGIAFIDAARSYGLAEQFLRAWWEERRLRDGALTVASKWGYIYTGSWRLDARVHEVKTLSVDTLRAQVAESRAMLGRQLSLYQIHSATLESGVLDDGDVLAELVHLRDQGLCIGLTVTGPQQADVIRRALNIRCDGVALFQTVQATWNLLEPSAGAALAEARAAGCGVIVKEVLANGRLTARHGGAELHRLQSHANELGATVETVATAAALAQPWADVVLCGAITPEQLQAPLAALDLESYVLPTPPMAEHADVYWRRRAALRWG
jgi:aryl-alcohol dehydrogenase-like predicted oxidoreductase